MKPEIINGIFAIVGALIGVIGTAIVTRSNKDTSKITVFRSPSSRLLDVEDMAKSDIEIKYKGNVITELFHGEVAVQNTGTKSFENIEVKILPKPNSPIFDAEISSTNFHKENDSLSLTKLESGEVKINIGFLNPNDRIVVSYRSSGEEAPDAVSRKLGVDVELKDEAVNWIPDIYAKLLFEIFEQIPYMQWYFKHFSKPYQLYLDAKRKDNA